MNGIDALKAKFADVELKANARTMEEVVAYIEENWGAFRVKITESELMAHYKAACEFAKMMGKDVTDFQDDIRRYRLPNTNKIHVVLGMNSEYMTAENGMKYYQALCLSAVRDRRLRKSGKCTMQGLSVFPMGMNLRILPHS